MVFSCRYLAQRKHSGHHVWLDMFIMLLITQTLLSIFEQQCLLEEEHLQFEVQLQKLRGEVKLLEACKAKQ